MCGGVKETHRNICFFPQRYFLAFMIFMCTVLTYFMRITLNVAILHMSTRNGPRDSAPPSSGGGEEGSESLISPVVVSLYQNETHINADALTGTIRRSLPTVLFDWDYNEQGLALASFYWGYCLIQIPSGLVASRMGGKWVLGIGTFIFSACTIATPVLVDYYELYGLIFLRVIGGLGNGVLYPCAAALLESWAPLTERIFLYNIVPTGAFVGTIIGSVMSTALLRSYNWEKPFHVWGVCGFIWCFFWFCFAFSRPSSHPCITDEEKDYLQNETVPPNNDKPPLSKIFACCPIWAVFVADFGHGWLFFLFLTNIPLYLYNVHGFDIIQIGFYYALPFLLLWATCLFFGIICENQIRTERWSRAFTRRFFASIGTFPTCALILGVTYFANNEVLTAVCLCFALAFKAGTYSGVQGNTLDIAPNNAGVINSVGNFVAALAATISPWAALYVTPNQTAEEYRDMFWLATAILIGTNTVFMVWGSTAREEWDLA